MATKLAAMLNADNATRQTNIDKYRLHPRWQRSDKGKE